AVVLEYGGSSPQPIFVMGRTDGIVAILSDVIRPRAAYAAALPEHAPALEQLYRVDPGPQMVRMWVDRARFRPYPADVQRPRPVVCDRGDRRSHGRAASDVRSGGPQRPLG